ncbi:MAG: alpha-galactosidase [Chloroflexi bacterium]|nr:alpha-galactosidase [Chloroflexota bacterium]
MTDHFFLEHQGMVLDFQQSEEAMNLLAVNTSRSRIERTPCAAYPPFVAGLAGQPWGFMPSTVAGYAALPQEMRLEYIAEEPGNLLMRYVHTASKLAVLVELHAIPSAAVIRQTTTAINEGNTPLTLTHLSSACLQGLASDGLRAWDDPSKLRLHYCRQAWEGEGQWRQSGIEELGLYRTSVHPCGTAVHLSSIGSWSTASYLPMAVLEDLETGKVWNWQIEASSSWHMELGYRAAWSGNAGGLFMDVDAASERHTGWSKTLAPGERFTAAPAAWGCTSGGFTQAIEQLTRYRRMVLKPQPADTKEPPLMFNDYMNCLWGDPTAEKLLPLIDAAAAVGAEGFCIDAGWFAPRAGSWGNGLGDWRPSPDRFGELGLEGILRYIKNKGLIPGLWLEMEVCGEDAALAAKPDGWFLLNHGRRIGGGSRWFLNFTNPEVCAYLQGVIDRLVEMGVGYIKNDYNACIGPQVANVNSGGADGLLQHSRAFYNFIDKVRDRHPRLIIENCGSGAMRSDYAALAHFHLQSSSDQEIHTLYPSIIAGSLAAVLPEQLGVWAYPWPLLFPHKDNADILQSDTYRAQMADGEQTVFNMVSGLCGNMYLSGHIDCADAFNQALIREGTALYKSERPFITRSHPLWPSGMPRFMDADTWVSVGLTDDESRILLAVWRLASAASEFMLRLPHMSGRALRVRQLYPSQGFNAPTTWNSAEGTLTVKLASPNSARLYELLVN